MDNAADEYLAPIARSTSVVLLGCLGLALCAACSPSPGPGPGELACGECADAGWAAHLVPTAANGGTIATLTSGKETEDDPFQGSIAVQGNEVFLTGTGFSEVIRLPLSGSGGMVLGPTPPFPVSLAADATHVYVWSAGTFTPNQPESAPNNSDGAVVEIPLAGGTVLTLAQNMEVPFYGAHLHSIAVDPANVYWVQGAQGTDGVIMKAAIGSPNATALYTGQAIPVAIATDGTNVYWANEGTNNDGALLQAPVNGGTPITLASPASALTIAIDSKNVYWTNGASILQVAIGGGQVLTLSSSQFGALGIAVQNGVVYWADSEGMTPGSIKSVPVGGGTVTTVVNGLANPYALAISGQTLIWTQQGSAVLSLNPL